MFEAVIESAASAHRPPHLPLAGQPSSATATPTAARPSASGVRAGAGRGIAEALACLDQALAPTRRLVHAGDVIFRAGERFDCLYVLNSGMVKMVKLAADGREQVVGLKFRGDWLGFHGIAHGEYGCDAVAMDTGEVWAVRYDRLLAAAVNQPVLLALVHEAMSREIGRDRESLMSVCTLSADARVADFLRWWAESLGDRGLRTDQITLRMTRAEIGNYLGLTLESVSRALSKLARHAVISFCEKGRRDVRIPDVAALTAFVQRTLAPEAIVLQ
jgi:CRP/FNR family transcriptional regulator